MPRRNSHKVGQWLVEDEVTGLVHYSGEMTRDYLGRIVKADTADKRNMQDFVSSFPERQDLFFFSVKDKVTTDLCTPSTVGNTNVPTPNESPGYQFSNPGIGEMEIGLNFCVG